MFKVIIADDEAHICKLVQALVDWETLGLKVMGTASNGLEAIALVDECKPDILITDIRMPGCNGLELIEKVKSKQENIEIIIISGYAHFEYAQSAIKYGVGDYLLKPIKRDELIQTLEKIRDKFNARTEMDSHADIVHKNSKQDLTRLRNSLIQDIQQGRIGEVTSEKLLYSYHFHVEEGKFQAFALKIDCEGTTNHEGAQKILYERAEEIFETILEKECIDYIFCFEKFSGFGILHYKKDNRNLIRKGLRNALNKLEELKNLYGTFSFSLALGGSDGSSSFIPESLKEAETVIYERLIEGTGRMLEGLPKASQIQKQELLERYTKMITIAIETVDIQTADDAVNDLEKKVLEVQNVRGLELYDIVILAGNLFVSRMGIDNLEDILINFRNGCSQISKVNKLFDNLRSLQRRLINEVITNRMNESVRPIRNAKQYVRQHFAEPLTLEEVCNAIGFSISYFSVLFKKETGEGFMKYLTRIRMEEAKILLRETNLPVAQICEDVGYNDRKHFTQTFNKVVGLNPAEYRKLYG
ncbi:MAG: DNA-binding response regulator [Anaerocolumna sp.]|nr:DNA-binding response regulator [Anaerocolumna sp.]